MNYFPARRRFLGVLTLVLLLGAVPADADWLEALGLRKKARDMRTLSEDQIAKGLKEALGVGVRQAVETLGRADGFLRDADVKIPLPAGLQRAETALRGLGQEKLADEFVATLNRAAEQAVPETAVVLADSVQQMTLEDARTILTSTNTAATDYFRRTSQTNLHARLLPIVKTATANAGVTASYKELLEKAGAGRSGLLGGLSRAFLGTDTLDIDDYVTRKTLDGLFVKIAEQEILIRENPSARTTAILEQVFGRARK